MPSSNNSSKSEVKSNAGASYSKGTYEKVKFSEALKISKWSISLFYKNYPVQTITFITTSIISKFQRLIYAFLFAKIIDGLLTAIKQPGASITSLYKYLAIMATYSLFQTLLSYVSNRARNVIRTRSWTFLRRELYRKLNSLGIQSLEVPEINNKIFRANDYLQNIYMYLDESVSLIADFVSFISILVIVGAFLPIYALAIILVSVPYLIKDKELRKNQYKFRIENTEGDRVSWWVGSDLTSPQNLQEISITNAFSWMDNKFSSFRNWFDDVRIKMSQDFATFSHIFFGLRDFVIIYGYVIIFKKFLGGLLSIGSISFWMGTFSNLGDSLDNTIRDFNDISEFALQIKDVYLLFNTKPAFEDGKVEMGSIKTGPSIDFKNVSFIYPNSEKTVIKNLSLNVIPGEKIAIVGHNGAGKTTLVKLISRFYKTTEGDILINETNVNDLKQESLYRNIGVLAQEFNRYPHLTVKENICLGRPEEEIDEKSMRVAAQTADAINFIEEYPKKFDQLLSERFKGGIRPSTGQWQKIAIARFFYRNSPLVIFDEPTASIDAVSEYHIFGEIYDFFEGKTVIIISHRFSTVRNADRIIVLDEGQIVEEGTHEELMKMNGKYAEGFKLQAEGYTDLGFCERDQKISSLS